MTPQIWGVWVFRERARPVIFETFLLEFILSDRFQYFCPARRTKPENYWKRELIPERAYPAIESAILQKFFLKTLFRIRYNFGPDSSI